MVPRLPWANGLSRLPRTGRPVTFGKRIDEDLVPAGAPLMLSEVYAGGEVVYRRRRATVVAVLPTETPGGSEVVLARIRFPRGGEQTVFAGQLEGKT